MISKPTFPLSLVRVGLSGLLALSALSLPQGALAQGRPAAPAPAPFVFATPESLSAFLKKEGYALEVSTDGEGDPLLSGKIDDLTLSIYFYGCDDEHKNCKEVQFYGGFQRPDKLAPKKLAQRVLDWNRDRRFARAYIDKVGDPCIEMDVDMKGGMPQALFASNFEHWRLMMQGFYGFIYAGD